QALNVGSLDVRLPARMNARAIEPGPTPTPIPIDTFTEGYAAIVLVICIVAGILIGVFVAISCHSRGYQKIPTSTSDGISLKVSLLCFCCSLPCAVEDSQ